MGGRQGAGMSGGWAVGSRHVRWMGGKEQACQVDGRQACQVGGRQAAGVAGGWAAGSRCVKWVGEAGVRNVKGLQKHITTQHCTIIVIRWAHCLH